MARKSSKIKQDKYIAEYVSNGGVKKHAAKKLKIPYQTVIYWHNNDKEFNERLDAEKSIWYEALKASMMKRAMQKSDTLGIFFLKAEFPEKYDDFVRRNRFMDEIVEEVKKSLPRLAPVIADKPDD